MNSMKLETRNAAGVRTGQIDGYNEFKAVVRYNAAGSWTLDMDYTLDQAALFDRYSGVVLSLDGTVLFSGPVSGIRRERTIQKNTIFLAGKDDLGLIAERLALPDPAGPPYSGYEFDVRTGAAETVVKTYVNYNAAVLAKLSRRIPGLTIALDQRRGTTVTGRGRFDQMLDFIVSLATIGGIGVSCRDLVFDCCIPTDRTASIVLSDAMGTLGDFSYDISAPGMNYVFCGGSGAGVARAFAEKGDSQSAIDWRLLEGFLNYNRTAVTAELLDAATDELTKRSGGIKITLASQALPGRELFVDYQLGDIVTAIIDGVSIPVRAVEAEIVLSGDGSQMVTPVFAAGTTPVDLLHNFDQNARSRRSVDRLERA